MGTTLTGKNISASYLGLLKTTDNAVIGGTGKIITDGNGNDSPLYLSTTRVGIGITPTSLLHVNGDANINTLTVGLGSGSISTNTVFGNNALKQNTTGYMNTAIGVDALRNNTDGDNNIAIGRLNLDANTSGIRNVALGNQSLTSNTTGSYNVGLGYDGLSGLSSGGYNVGIGYEAGNNITTGTGSIMIGGVTRSSAVTSSNEIVIGYNTTGNGSNTVTIGNSSITTNYFSGDILLGNSENLFWGNTSDVYIKGTTVSDNIQLGVGGSTQFTFAQTTGLRLHQYGGGTITGTATQRLGVDSSGNVIEIPIGAGALDGAGTAGKLAKFTDSDTLGDSIMSESGSTIEISSASTPQLRATDTTNTVTSKIMSDNSAGYVGTHTDHNFNILRNNSVQATFTSTGLGLGTTSPDVKTHIFGGSDSQENVLLKVQSNGVANDSSLSTSILLANSTGLTSIHGAKISAIRTGSATDDLTFSVYNTSMQERMRLDSSGRLGIGLTPTSSPLEIKSNSVSLNNSAISIIQNGGTDAIIKMGERDNNGGRLHMYDSGVEKIAFYTDGTDNHISAGNLGIGTSSPVFKTHLYDTGNTVLGITAGVSNYASLQFGSTSDTTRGAIEYYTGDDSLRLKTGNNIEVARLDSSGNLGLGVSSPAEAIDIKRNGATSAGIVLNQTGTNGRKYIISSTGTGYGSAGNLIFYDATVGSERLRIDSSGNVIKKVASASNGGYATNDGTNDLIAIGTGGYAVNGGTATDGGIRATNNLVFATGSGASERMRLNSSGNLELNGSAGPLFSVKSTATGNPTAFVYATTNGADFGSLTNHPTRFYVNNSEKARIDTSGRLGLGTTSPDSYYSGADNLVVYQASGGAGITIATATSNTGALYFADGTTGDEQYRGGIAYAHSTEKLSLVSGGSTKMTITDSGDVGIGVTSPQRILHTSGDIVRFDNAGTSAILLLDTTNNEGYRIVTNKDNGAFSIEDMGTATSGAGTERMRITSGGEFLVGTTDTDGDESNDANLIAGRHITTKGSVSGAVSGTAYTILTPPDASTWMVSVYVPSSSLSYVETAIVHSNLSNVNVTVLANGSNINITVSGGDVQVTQTSGANQNIGWSALRML